MNYFFELISVHFSHKLEPESEGKMNQKYFDVLREKYGSHRKAALALGIPLRTYMDWKNRGFKKASRSKLVEIFLEESLNAVKK